MAIRPFGLSKVADIRTVAAASESSEAIAEPDGSRLQPTVGLSLSVNSSPPPGSGIPVLDLSLQAYG